MSVVLRRPGRALAALTVLLALGVAAGATAAPRVDSGAVARAAGNPYSAWALCGAGYNLLRAKPLRSQGKRLGTAYLMWSPSAGKNCVVTLKTYQPGAPAAFMQAYLEVKGRRGVDDTGNFSWYAGPVRQDARGKCIKWSGSIIVGEGFGDGRGSYKWSHCD